MLCCSPAAAETWRFLSSVELEETFTNNVNLTPEKRSDFVTQFTPGFSIVETGAHTSLVAQVSLPFLLHTRSGTSNDDVIPQVSLLGTVEAIDRFFYVDAAAYVTQQFLSPFGAQPADLANASTNRYTTESYQVAPYIKGSRNNITYELRDTNIFTKSTGTDVSLNDSYLNEAKATVRRDPLPFGWGLDYDHQWLKYTDQDPLTSELVRFRGIYQADYQLRVAVSGGYENEDYVLEKFYGPIYGVGLQWDPSERTNLTAFLEHRFFGSSYRFDFNTRTPLTFARLLLSRDITTYPQQVGALPEGADVNALINQLFSSRYPDPAQRQPFVDQYIRDRGLPSTLLTPVNLYTQQVTLQEYEGVTIGTTGARNNVLLTLFRLKTEPIVEDASPFAVLNDNTQYGASFMWTHTLAPRLLLTSTVDLLRTTANPPQIGTTRQGSVNVKLSSDISPLTTVSAAVRYQRLRSDIADGYDETALIFTFDHRFH